MNEEETLTNQDEPEVIATAQAEAPPEDQATEEIQEGDEQEGEGQVELEEVEIDGKVYSVPKEIAPKIMMHKDYTQKTQGLSEDRQAHADERAAWHKEAQFREALREEEADLYAINKRVNAYANTNWQLWQQQDPNGAQAASMEYMQLRDTQQKLDGHIQGRKAELAFQHEQSTATVLNKAVEALSRPDPKLGWDGKFDAPKREQLTKFGRELGYTDDELAGTSHPLMIKTLQLAKIGLESLRKQNMAPARTPAEPAAKVPTSRASSPVNARSASMEVYAAARKAGRIK